MKISQKLTIIDINFKSLGKTFNDNVIKPTNYFNLKNFMKRLKVPMKKKVIIRFVLLYLYNPNKCIHLRHP